MNEIAVKRGWFWFCFSLLLGWAAVLPARADVVLLPMTNVWSYQQTTNLDGINWQAVSYDDTSWPKGNGLLYVENNFQVFPRNTPLILGRTTYYFRTRFNLAYPATNIILNFSSLIDDGAVFYLNGSEIRRIRMPAAPTVITYATMANGSPSFGGDAIINDFFPLPEDLKTNLWPGENVLAVEVHQNTTFSDDIVFGSQVYVRFTNTAPVLVRNPTDLSIVDGRTATLSAQLDGGPAPSLQWYRNGAPVPGATNASLVFNPVYPQHGGSYFLQASNQFGVLNSDSATLTVLVDSTSPAVTSALAQTNLTSIVVTFSEGVLPEGTNSANFEIFQANFPAQILPIQSVLRQNSNTYEIRTDPRVAGLNYKLKLSHIQDLSSSTNEIPSDSIVPLQYVAEFAGLGGKSYWKYFQEGREPVGDWTVWPYNDSSWLTGQSVFHGGVAPVLDEPILTTLAMTNTAGPIISYYFRLPVHFPGVIDPPSLRIHTLIEDGLVVYWNGQEVWSNGMPTNRPLSYGTSASTPVNNPYFSPLLFFPGYDISPTNLTLHRNLLSAEAHQHTNNLADAAFAVILRGVVTEYYPQIQLSTPAQILETSGTIVNGGSISLLEPLPTNFVVNLSSSRPQNLQLPDSVTIPAGQTNVSFDLIVLDDSLFSGNRSVEFLAENPGLSLASTSAELVENETNQLQVVIATRLVETNGSWPAQLQLSVPAGESLTVKLSSSDPSVLQVPASVSIATGQNSAQFSLTATNDNLLQIARATLITAWIQGGPTGSVTAVLWDDESTNLTLQLPSQVVEGAGTITNAASISLGGVAASNLVISLNSAAPEILTVPSNVVVAAGQSNVIFHLQVGDDSLSSTNRSVQVSAAAEGLAPAVRSLLVLENDPVRINFSATGPLVVDTNSYIGLVVTAFRADGSIETNFQQSVTFYADSLDGILPVNPTNSGAFFRGQKQVYLSVTQPGRLVRIKSVEYPGQSDIFNVILPPVYGSTQTVADIAWQESSQTLLATVPANGGTYSNSVVAIDVSRAVVTNAYPVFYDPSQIEMSPGGTFAYLAVSNRLAVQRFDLPNRTAGPRYILAGSADPQVRATDLCVPPGINNAVVVARQEYFNSGNVSSPQFWLYNSGSATPLAALTANGGWDLESLNTGFDVLAGPPLVRGTASTGNILARSTEPGGVRAYFREGEVYDSAGLVFSPSTLVKIRDYPHLVSDNRLTLFGAVGLPEVDPVTRKVFYLIGNPGFSVGCKVKVYDRDLRLYLNTIDLPAPFQTPVRFIRLGTNGLAYVANNQLWFIRPEAVRPTESPADLALKVATPPGPPQVGLDYTLTYSLSNAGPGLATLIRVTNTLPGNVEIVGTNFSTGQFYTSAGSFLWNVTSLPATSNGTLQVTLRFNSAGLQTNLAYAVGFEADLIGTNNMVTLPLNVELPPAGLGSFQLNFAAEDLVYDPVRDRLLLTVAQGIGYTNGIATLNPYNGQIESFASLGHRPGKILRTDQGEFFYISLPETGLVRRLNPNLSPSLDIVLGGEFIYGLWYPFFAGDVACVPGKPGELAVWRVRKAGPMASQFPFGIGLYDNGMLRSNVTANGGLYNLEFNRDTTGLYAMEYGSPTLQKCLVDSNGVAFVQNWPLHYSMGSDLEYGRGRMWITRGRAIDLSTHQVKAILAGSEDAQLVEPDSQSGRVFYLTAQGGVATVRGYDMESYLPVGSLSISNVPGTVSSLIRWGSNGLACLTSSNRVLLFKGPPVSLPASVDLNLALAGPVQAAAGSDFPWSISVTNQGTNAAAEVRVTHQFSTNISLSSIAPGTGNYSLNSNQLVWSIGGLAPGASAQLNLSVRSESEGAASIRAEVQSDLEDSNRSNNHSVLWTIVGTGSNQESIVAIPLAARELLYDASRGRILATISSNHLNWANSLVSIQPEDGKIQYVTAVGSGAGKMAVARDAAQERLLVSIDYGLQILDLATLVRGPRFSWDIQGAFLQALDLESVPGSSQSYAGAFADRVTAYDEGIARSNYFGKASSAITFYRSNALQTVRPYYYGPVEMEALRLSSNGLDSIKAVPDIGEWNDGLDLRNAGGKTFLSSGPIFDSETMVQLGSFGSITPQALMVPDEAAARVYFLTWRTSIWELQAFSPETHQMLGRMGIPGVLGRPASLIRWGTNGFAFTTSSNQLFLVQSRLVPAAPAHDLQLDLQVPSGSLAVGDLLNYTLSISNSGPNPAQQVEWTFSVPSSVLLSSVSGAASNLRTNGNVLTGIIPTLAAGAFAQVQVTLQPQAIGVFSGAASVHSTGLDFNETNNLANYAGWVHPSNSSASASMTLPLKDIVPHPTLPLLYATVGTNSGDAAGCVIALDLAARRIAQIRWVGHNPGRLAIAGDGSVLFVGLDDEGSAVRLSLPSLGVNLRIPVDEGRDVQNLAVSPQNPQLLALWRQFGNALQIYDNGVKRTNAVANLDVFAFSDMSGELYAAQSSFSNQKLYRIDLGPTGPVATDPQPGRQTQATQAKFDQGLLHFNLGMIVEPATQKLKATLPIPFNSLVEPDSGCGRIFYFCPGSNSFSWQLRAYDAQQGIEINRENVSISSGTPKQLFRWGANGFAMLTTTERLYTWQSPLVPTLPAVDLALKQSASRLLVTTNDTVTFSLAVTNPGPATATSLLLTQGFSLAVTGVVAIPSAGVASVTNNRVTWDLLSLAPGSQATLEVTLRPTQNGTLNAQASVLPGANDPRLANNAALNSVRVGASSSTNTVQLPLPARELVYDSERDLIYASVALTNDYFANSIVLISPVTGSVLGSFYAGADPDQLALSTDQDYLLVSLKGSGTARRFHLPTGQVDFEVDFADTNLNFVADLAVHPRVPDTFAAALTGSVRAGDVVIYDLQNPRPRRGGPSTDLEFSDDGQQLFNFLPSGGGLGMIRMTLGPLGIVSNELHSAIWSSSVPLRFANGRLYSGSGVVIDPSIPAQLGSMPASGPHEVDPAFNRAYFITPLGTNYQFQSFDTRTLQLASTQALTNIRGVPNNLIRCGADLLAFRTSSNQVYLVRSPVVGTNPAAAASLSVAQTVSQDFATNQETINYSIQISNAGPAAAAQVMAAIRWPSGLAGMDLQQPQGTRTQSNGVFVCQLGSIAAGQSVQLILRGLITNTLTYSNLVSVSAAELDLDLSDNVSLATITGLYFQRTNTSKSFGYVVKALAYDAENQKLMAATTNAGQNWIVSLDPVTGARQSMVPSPFAVQAMEVTENGRYLYVSGVNTGLIQRYSLPALVPDLAFSPPGAVSNRSLALVPGWPDAVLATTLTTNGWVAAIYDQGVARSNQVANIPFSIWAAEPNSLNLFGYAHTNFSSDAYRMHRLVAGSQGLTLAETAPQNRPASLEARMVWANRRLVFQNGPVLNPEGWSMESSFPLFGGGSGLVYLPALDQTVFLNNELKFYNASTRQLLNATSVPAGHTLVYCGTDRFAYISPPDKLIIVRATAGAVADLRLDATLSTNQVVRGDSLVVQLTFTHAGPDPVAGAVITNLLPAGMRLVSHSASNATVVTNALALVATYGSMVAGQSNRLTLVLTSTGETNGWSTNVASVTPLGTPDHVASNNRSQLAIRLLSEDEDHDGLPDRWEREHGLDPNNPSDVWLDSDCDEKSNLEEYLAGTNPTLVEGIRATLSQYEPGSTIFNTNGVTLKVVAPAAQNYLVQYSSNLIHWENWTNYSSPDCSAELLDRSSRDRGIRFYRIVQQ